MPTTKAQSVIQTNDNVLETAIRDLLAVVISNLDNSKAEDILAIDLRQYSALSDYMIIASGRSQRHVNSIADHLLRCLKEHKIKKVNIEGLQGGDWILVDAGDVIVHIFEQEKRAFYNIEKLWSHDENLIDISNYVKE